MYFLLDTAGFTIACFIAILDERDSDPVATADQDLVNQPDNINEPPLLEQTVPVTISDLNKVSTSLIIFLNFYIYFNVYPFFNLKWKPFLYLTLFFMQFF